jgi:hypothetical protein
MIRFCRDRNIRDVSADCSRCCFDHVDPGFRLVDRAGHCRTRAVRHGVFA